MKILPSRIRISAGRCSPPASYGGWTRPVQAFLLVVLLALLTWSADAAERAVQIVALGDSLTAGYGLPPSAALPARLEQALRAKGRAVALVNAGVSGDTAAGGLARLDWSVPAGTDAVIVALGANDMLRGVDPAATRRALEEIVRRLRDRGIPVLLVGMRAAPNLGADYGRAFEAIYPALAAEYGLLLHPFLLDGIAAEARLNQRDGIHPTAAGVDVMVERILPQVEELLARVAAKGVMSP